VVRVDVSLQFRSVTLVFSDEGGVVGDGSEAFYFLRKGPGGQF
jgi:hypothetical protein